MDACFAEVVASYVPSAARADPATNSTAALATTIIVFVIFQHRIVFSLG
jgi:hypothetical protein